MARRILPALDLRTAEERRGLTESQRNIQAITSILQTMGQAEKVRRDRQTLNRVATAVAGGATTIEAIASIAQEQPQFGTGIQGILQKIGGAFQPQGGGDARQNILQMIIGQKLKQALAPKFEEPTGAFAPGTVTQRGPTGKVGVLQQPAKPAKRTKASVLLKQIDRKIAAGTLKEGSAEHLRLLGASGDKIKTPEDKLKFWQTVLQKTKDAIGTTFEGQESTAKLAADKIEEAKGQIRGKLPATTQVEEKTLDTAMARAILQEAGGDRDKAREIARQRGFKF